MNEILRAIYAKRPDLQAVYDQNGNARNPNDPRVSGIPTIFDWAQIHGVKEEPTLRQPEAQLSGDYLELYNELKGYLDTLQSKGQTINPNVEITPEKLAEFTAQAQNEIAPYYSGQLKLARQSLLEGLGYSKDQILEKENDLEQKYGKSLRTLGENAAETGFALSGRRVQDEADLARDTQTALNDLRSDTLHNNTIAAENFAQKYGTANLPELDVSAVPTVQAGRSTFSRVGASTPYYNLSRSLYDNLKGSDQFQQEKDTRVRASELESAFRSNQAIDNQRKLL